MKNTNNNINQQLCMHVAAQRARALFLSLILGAVWGGQPLMASAQESDNEFHQTFPLSAGGKVSLDNVNGSIRITSWDRAEVKVDAVKRGKTAEETSEIKIEVAANQDSVDIKTRMPNSRMGRGSSGSVDYQVTVPRQVRLDKINSVNASVNLDRITGPVAVSVVNGALTARQMSGSGAYNSVNGAMNVSYTKLADDKGISLETVNGKASLAIPANSNAEVKLDTLNGAIHNDFDLTVEKHFPVGKSLKGQLGTGGPSIKLHSVNGALSLGKSE
jgi:DUF4097 and DUF4098 domain-containing protein YvlB